MAKKKAASRSRVKGRAPRAKKSPANRTTRVPADLETAINEALSSGRAMVAVAWVEGGQVKLFRKTVNFPVPDFATVLGMLEKSLATAK